MPISRIARTCVLAAAAATAVSLASADPASATEIPIPISYSVTGSTVVKKTGSTLDLGPGSLAGNLLVDDQTGAVGLNANLQLPPATAHISLLAGGFKIKAKVKWSDIPTDELGVIEKELDMLEVTASFTPMGIAQADLDAKLVMQNGASAARGARLSTISEDLIITGTDVYVMMRQAFMRKLPMQSGTDGKGRFGEVEAVSTLGITTGAAVAMLYVGTAAPA